MVRSTAWRATSLAEDTVRTASIAASSGDDGGQGLGTGCLRCVRDWPVTRQSSSASRISLAVREHAEAARIATRLFGTAPREDKRVDRKSHRSAAVARGAGSLPRPGRRGCCRARDRRLGVGRVRLRTVVGAPAWSSRLRRGLFAPSCDRPPRRAWSSTSS
jgi:hypothetical protein